MAQIEQSDGGKKKKGAQKKMHIHVDFTPMVDMNMLLITFFMLCTTMLKPQTLSVALPAPPAEEQTKENSEQAAESNALTLIIDTERDDKGNPVIGEDGKATDLVYWYGGFEPTVGEDEVTIKNMDGEVIENPLKVERFIGNSGDERNGIRAVLFERNKEVLKDIKDAKDLWRQGKIDKDSFEAMAKKIRNDSNYTSRPQVTIKATNNASWESVISALDEMQINQISQYRIGTFTSNDSLLIENYRKSH